MKAQFLLGKPSIKVGTHFNQRLKNRVQIKKEKSRHKFVKKVAESAISIYNIPQDEYNEFYSYMYKKMRSIQKRNLYAFLVLFENWFIVTSVDGFLITLFQIEKKFKDIYFSIMKSIEGQEEE